MPVRCPPQRLELKTSTDVCHRPVSGLASDAQCIGLITFPCNAQWSIDQVSLAYRCGGSAGIATYRGPASRFTRSEIGHLWCDQCS